MQRSPWRRRSTPTAADRPLILVRERRNWLLTGFPTRAISHQRHGAGRTLQPTLDELASVHREPCSTQRAGPGRVLTATTRPDDRTARFFTGATNASRAGPQGIATCPSVTSQTDCRFRDWNQQRAPRTMTVGGRQRSPRCQKPGWAEAQAGSQRRSTCSPEPVWHRRRHYDWTRSGQKIRRQRHHQCRCCAVARSASRPGLRSRSM